MPKNTERQTTRREMMRGAALGVGLLACGRNPCPATDEVLKRSVGPPLPIARTNPAIRHLRAACRECGRCREFCHGVTTVFGHEVPEGEDACIHCGQCTLFCKADALSETFHYPAVYRAVADKDRIVVASTSPAIRVALGEMFGMAPGTNVEGQTVGALRRLGVDYVLDTTFAADLVVVEEATELLRRLEKKEQGHPLPMFTSCCPAWIRFARLFYPSLLPNISTVKSPVMAQGALVKSYFARTHRLDPAKILHVALTPCTAKKAEILLPGMNAAGAPALRDVDAALTCRELGTLLKGAKIALPKMKEDEYDPLMGAGSGAGMIFGNTGGVTEAVLRTAYRLATGENPPTEFYRMQAVRGHRNFRRATVGLGSHTLNIGIVHGVGSARPLLDAVKSGRTDLDFIEIMACPGGCIGGGGQPRDHDTDPEQLRRLRLDALYRHDAGRELRTSHENPEVRQLYADFLGEPCGERSRRLLHCR